MSKRKKKESESMMIRKQITQGIVITALLLTPVIIQARWMNPYSGRFQTLDSFEGNNQDPPSLHKYLYSGDNPIGKTDPSGMDTADTIAALSIGESLLSFALPATSKALSVFDTPWGASRFLTQNEITLARTIYGATIDYTKTGVDYGKWAWWQPKGREMTPDGIIHTGGDVISDYTVDGAKPSFQAGLIPQKSILIHELCHVWQEQVLHYNLVMRGIDRNYKYASWSFGKLAFTDYGIEAQAQMTQDYYLLKNGYQSETVPNPIPPLATYEKVIPFLPK